jgi:2-dehydropantoate 2-reductase
VCVCHPRPVRIAILGPGGVGGFLAAVLARAGEEVVVVARPGTAAAIAADGIRVQSALLGDLHARPAAVSELDEAADVLLVATKATALADALSRVRAAPELVVPLLNGLEHMGVLRAELGAGRVAAGTIRIESARVAPGLIVQSSPAARVELAGGRADLRPALAAVAELLTAAGVPARVLDSEAQVLWSKLVRLTALALTTSAFDAPLGAIRDSGPGRAALEGAVRETAAVAAADGAVIAPEDTMAELTEAHPGLGSSMQRDIAAGEVPELDAIAGAVLRAARRHGVPCPTVAELTARVAERAGIAAPLV